MMQKAQSSIEEVPYCFSGSSIKFQGHMGWKIDDLNPISVRLLGPSQLSNAPVDLVIVVFQSSNNHSMLFFNQMIMQISWFLRVCKQFIFISLVLFVNFWSFVYSVIIYWETKYLLHIEVLKNGTILQITFSNDFLLCKVLYLYFTEDCS